MAKFNSKNCILCPQYVVYDVYSLYTRGRREYLCASASPPRLRVNNLNKKVTKPEDTPLTEFNRKP
jgi:hypothetical protein